MRRPYNTPSQYLGTWSSPPSALAAWFDLSTRSRYRTLRIQPVEIVEGFGSGRSPLSYGIPETYGLKYYGKEKVQVFAGLSGECAWISVTC